MRRSGSCQLLGISLWPLLYSKIDRIFILEYGMLSEQVLSLTIRETREGWPLLAVETEVNGNSKRTNERSPFLVGSLGLRCWQEIFVLPWLLSSAQYKIFFSSKYTFPISLSSSPNKLGRQPCRVAHCLMRVSVYNAPIQ
jgi:hypothetical protein